MPKSTKQNTERAFLRPIHQTRHRNLMAVLNDRFAGNAAALARAVGIDPTIISRYVGNRANDSSNIGDANATKIEESLCLAPGWLDADHQLANAANQHQAINGNLLARAVNVALLAKDVQLPQAECANIAHVASVLYAAYLRGENLSPETVLALGATAR